MRKRKTWNQLVVVIILVNGFLLGGCINNILNPSPGSFEPTPSPVPTPISADDPTVRWALGIPCMLPCWEGIIVGETTISEAIEVFESDPIISSYLTDTDFVTSSSPTYLGENLDSLWIGSSGLQLTLASDSENIDNIVQGFSTRNSRKPVCLGTVIDTYGEPTSAGVYPFTHGGGETTYYMGLYWEKYQFILEVSVFYVALEFNDDLCRFTLYVLEDPTGFNGEMTIDRLLPWDGYGDYIKYEVNSP